MIVAEFEMALCEGCGDEVEKTFAFVFLSNCCRDCRSVNADFAMDRIVADHKPRLKMFGRPQHVPFMDRLKAALP